jgi:hypothetical protein
VRRCLALALAVLAWPLLASAQDGGSVFVSGPLLWSPALSLRDIGWDTNVYDSPTAPQADFAATLSPGANVAMNTAHLKVTSAAQIDLVYYEKQVKDRAFNRRFNGRVEAPMGFVVPFVAGAYQRAKDRPELEVDVPQQHHGQDVSAGANLLFATRAVAGFTLRRETTTYEQGQYVRGNDVARNLNRRTEGGAASVRMNLTPLTSVIADASLSRDRYPLAPEKAQDNSRATVSLEFAPDAVVRGRAGVGYHRLTAVDPSAVSYQGFTFDIDLSYLLRGSTRFGGRYNRDTAASVEAPYYLQTTYGLDVLQTFIGPTELIGRINRQNADYPRMANLSLVSRNDITDTCGGGLAIRMARASRMTFNYEYSRRQSVRDQLIYIRHRVFTSVLLGF